MSTTITKSQLREHIAKLVAEQLKEQQSRWNRDELSDLYKTKYRVNFGQGQVSNTFSSMKEAEDELLYFVENDPHAKNMFIQSKDPDTGEWFKVTSSLREQHRIEGDKLHSDEMDFFDTDEFHDDEFGGFEDATPGVIPYDDDPWDSDLGEPYDDFEDHVELGYGEPDSGSYDLYDDMSDDDLDRRY